MQKQNLWGKYYIACYQINIHHNLLVLMRQRLLVNH